MPGETPRKKVGRGYARNTDAGALETMVSNFELHLRAEHKSEKTITTYLDAARWFAAAHLLPAGVTDWADVRARHVQQWTVWLLASYADTYATNQFRALQQFFRWHATEDPDEPRPNPMARLSPPKVADKLVPVITDDELDAMLVKCKGGGFENRRDYVVISLFNDTGIRLAELAGLRLPDVSIGNREATVTGKGDKQRTVRFSYDTARALDRYMRRQGRHRVTVRGPPVFRDTGQDRQLPSRVSVHLAGEHASCAADWRLFCPESWDDKALRDPAEAARAASRRARAGIPDEVRHAGKWRLALEMLDEMAGPGGWGVLEQVTAVGGDRPVASADAGYGDNTTFRLELQKRGWQYVVAVKGTTSAHAGDARPAARSLGGGPGRPPKPA